MTSSIGAGAFGEPTKIPTKTPFRIGSTSGIGGQSTENVKKYDAIYTHHLRYKPGSKRFWKLGHGNYYGPTGNWGHRVLTKVTPRRQVSGAAGILNTNPLARIKQTKFISMNYGIVAKVDPQLPRGGNIPRVVDTSNVEDPRAFYSDFNWGNDHQQRHDQSAGPYYTVPENPAAETIDRPPPELNPMMGQNALGLGQVDREANTNNWVETQVDAETDAIIPDPMAALEQQFGQTGAADFSRRRAAGITHVYDDIGTSNSKNAGTRILGKADGLKATQSSGRGGNTEVGEGQDKLNGIQAGEGPDTAQPMSEHLSSHGTHDDLSQLTYNEIEKRLETARRKLEKAIKKKDKPLVKYYKREIQHYRRGLAKLDKMVIDKKEKEPKGKQKAADKMEI